MFEFVHWGFVVITLFLLIVGYGLLANEEKDKKSYFFFGATIAMFLFVLFVFPYFEKEKANENIERFQKGEMIECTSSNGALNRGETYLVKNDKWEQHQYSFVKKDTRLVIKANRCD